MMFKVDLPPEPKGWEEVKPADYVKLENRIKELEAMIGTIATGNLEAQNRAARRNDNLEQRNRALVEALKKINLTMFSLPAAYMLVEIKKIAKQALKEAEGGWNG